MAQGQLVPQNENIMKKIKLFTIALAAIFAGNVVAEETTTGTYSVRTIDGATSTWSYAFKPASDIKVPSGTENGVYYKSEKDGNQKVSKSGYLSNKGKSTIGFEVPSATAAGTITMTVGSSSDSRYYQLYINGTAGNENQRLWSKVGDDLTTKGPQSYTFTSADISTINGKYYLTFTDNNTEMKPATFKVVLTNDTYEALATDIATLSAITIDGKALEDFNAETLEYNVELPFGTTDVPVVAATKTAPKATAVVTPAAAIPGTTTIVVTAEDGTTVKTYTVNFTTAQEQSKDATLSALTINGKGVSGFKADSLNYAYEVAYQGEIPVVAATVNDETASLQITQITAFPGTATVVVTAQAGNTLTYTIDFTIATAPKILTEVVFSNGAKGAALDGVVRVPYLAGQEVPTVESFTTNEGATAVKAENGKTITVTGEDETTLVYTIEAVELTPAALGTEEVTFNGEETYVFDPYGWDASKGWKFAKKTEDASNRRVSEGRTRVYMALPAAKEVMLTSGSGGVRSIKVYVNGVENTDVTTSARNGEAVTIALDSNNANFLAIESNQTSGDGGFTRIQLVAAGTGTALDNVSVAGQVQKMIIDGQLVIVKNGVMYNAQGMTINK